MLLLKPKNIFKLLCHSLLVFSIIFFLLINSFPWFLNISYLQNRLFQTITNQNQFTINSNDIDIDLFPAPALRLKNLKIKSKDRVEYTCQTILISPDLIHLVKGKIVLKKISILNSNLNFVPTKESSSKTRNLSSLFKTNQIEKYIDKKKGLSIFINNFKHDFTGSLNIKIKVQSNKNISGDISITNYALKKELLKKYRFNKNIFNLNSNNDKNLIFIKDLKARFNITDQKVKVIATPILFKYPSMTLGIKFLYNISTDKAFIEFLGKNVNIHQAKTAYFDLFNKEDISENLFDIVRAGNASSISVVFNEKKLKNLFNPKNMVLSGQLEKGDIKIPNTKLIPNKVYGTAFIKNGILYIKAEKGQIHNAKINHGILEIDLLNQEDYPFHGTFGIHAPLLDVRNILIELLDDTLLAKELKLVNNVNGYVNGELKLKLKTGEDLEVIVITEKIKGSGDYTRAPGKIKVNHGKFSYKNDAVTLTDFAGKIGNSYYYNFSGSYSLDNTNVIDIKSANALVDSNEIFSWLVGFNVIEEIVPSLSVDEGYVRIDSTCIKGDIFNVKELVFDVNGLLFDNRFREKSNNNSNFLSSCRFDISNKGYSFDEIIGKVSDVDLISTFTPKGDINSLATPFMIKNGVYKSFDNIYSFNGELEFESGPIVKLSTTNHKEETCLNKLEVKEALNTNIKFLTDNNKNVDFYSFKGQLNVETLEKIFTENSHYYNKLIAFTDQSNATITSYSGSLITISACTLNLEPILDQLFAKNNDQLCLKSQNSNNFSEKKIKLKTEMLKYQGSHFGNFIVDLSLKQEKNKFQGTLDITSKLGKINGLTLISRILSAINISNYFKNGGPDFKQTGFKYKSIVIKANIVDNKILLKEAVIDGQDMTLVFTGSIDIKKNDLNLTCLIAPFKTIDLLVEKIPVVNVMLNNTLISIPVKISGEIGDPTVVPMHPVSVGKGIINLFANIIKAPFKLLKALPKSTSSENNSFGKASLEVDGP